MEITSNMVCSYLMDNTQEFWVAEWHINGEGNRAFNIDTLDKHFQSNYNNLMNNKKSTYYLLGIVPSIEDAHELIEEFKKKMVVSG